MITFMLAVFFLLLLTGTPIAFSLGITAVLVFLKMDAPILLKMVPLKFYSGIDMFALMAMPLFMMAGEIMNRIRVTHRLVELANVLIGNIRGALAHVNIMVSILFAGLTGAAVADTAALGTMLIPAMEKAGYPRSFSAAVTAASSIIGPIIPPSIIMVIYGSMMNVSIAGLFAAGIIPGFLVGVALMLLSARISSKRGYPKGERRATMMEMGIAFRRAIIPLLTPIIILGGILTGIFTPTEAAAVAVLYAMLIGFFVYRNFRLRDLPSVLLEMVRNSGSVFIILSAASILGWLLASEQIPELVGQQIMNLSSNKYTALLIINVILLIIGMFMDMTAVVIILGPILHPLAVSLGIHPLHFGIIMIVNVNIALMTPPLGACLFVACSISRISLEAISKEILPFIGAEVVVLILVTYIPAISMTIPRLLGFA
ncbi:MAG: TRAP transporter large permease [Deltaproteobacteria bacterium]|nr:TRAP transporter large permease [Deltaproteobacteria bacterium]